MNLTQSHSSVIENEGRTFILSHTTNEEDSVQIKTLKDGRTMIGYLVPDSDCDDPQHNDDYFGSIYTAHRHSRTLDEMRKALGLNQYGDPNLDKVVIRPEDYDGFCNVEDFVAKLQEDTLGFSIDEIKEKLCQGDFDDEIMERFGVQLWTEGRINGTIGEQYAILLDVYEHSGVLYSVSTENKNVDPFDTARGGAVWVPSKAIKDDLAALPEAERHAKAMSYARSSAEQFTSWSNGDCWGHIIDIFEPDSAISEQHDDSECWGIIGGDNALTQLKEAFENVTKE